jgi:hypothetical protein
VVIWYFLFLGRFNLMGGHMCWGPSRSPFRYARFKKSFDNKIQLIEFWLSIQVQVVIKIHIRESHLLPLVVLVMISIKSLDLKVTKMQNTFLRTIMTTWSWRHLYWSLKCKIDIVEVMHTLCEFFVNKGCVTSHVNQACDNYQASEIW